MNKKAVWLLIVLLFTGYTLKAQCNNQLVEKAAEQAGADAIYIRDFKVKLSEGTMDEPSPTGKFPVYLNKGVTYRFSIANAKEFTGRAIVEIARRDQVYAGNYNFENKLYSKTFDFVCDRSTTYQVMINYGEGQEGCSAVVMAMVLQDSMNYIEPGVPVKSDSAGTLFLFTDNQLQIASSSGKDASLEVLISQGSIEKNGKYYIARPEKSGNALITVNVKKDSEIIETDSVEYKVEFPPLPMIQLPGETAGYLSLKRFHSMEQIQLISNAANNSTPYRLKQFSISADTFSVHEINSNGNKLSAEQAAMIMKSKPNDKIYIINSIFIDPEGNTHQAPSRTVFIIE